MRRTSLLMTSRIPAIVVATSLALGACGDGEPTVARLRAGVLDGAAGGEVTYTVDGETTTIVVEPGSDLDLDVELNGSFSLEVSIVNSSPDGEVRCGISNLIPGGSAARGSQDATCRAAGSVRNGSLEVSFDNESTDGPARIEIDGVLSVTVPPEFELDNNPSSRVLLEMTSPAGDILITTEPLDPAASTALEFGELYGSNTEAATVGGFDGVFTDYERTARSSFTVMRDDDVLIVATDIFPTEDRRALLTDLVASLDIVE